MIESKLNRKEQEEIVGKLLPLLVNIEKWIRVRSEHRRCWDDNGGIIHFEWNYRIIIKGHLIQKHRFLLRYLHSLMMLKSEKYLQSELFRVF